MCRPSEQHNAIRLLSASFKLNVFHQSTEHLTCSLSLFLVVYSCLQCASMPTTFSLFVWRWTQTCTDYLPLVLSLFSPWQKDSEKELQNEGWGLGWWVARWRLCILPSRGKLWKCEIETHCETVFIVDQQEDLTNKIFMDTNSRHCCSTQAQLLTSSGQMEISDWVQCACLTIFLLF